MTEAPNFEWKTSPFWQKWLFENTIRLGGIKKLRLARLTFNQRVGTGEVAHLTWPERRARSVAISQTILDPVLHNTWNTLAKRVSEQIEIHGF